MIIQAVTKEEYARWFQQIGEMNANAVRVYTVQPPAFYEAFYEYNQTADEPLYLFHGTWYDETRLTETGDAFDEGMQKYLYQDMENIVDLIHGNCTIEQHPGKASGTYQYDISPYVIGWILGIESDATFVSVTNENNPEITSYEGTYLCAEDLEPFEVFWTQTGDYILSYEMDKYGMQRPLSYSNWPTADVLEHPSETMEEEYRIDLNVENIEPTDAFPSGLFASYHIYPYYPNFLYTEKAYSDYRDEDGSVNTYKAYLKDMIEVHDMPVVVAEKQSKMLLTCHDIVPVCPAVRIGITFRIPCPLEPFVLPGKNKSARIAGIIYILHHCHKHFTLLVFRLISLIETGINIGMCHASGCRNTKFGNHNRHIMHLDHVFQIGFIGIDG